MLTPDFLHGACDMHLHFGPDVLPRQCTALQLARTARKAGLEAIVLKNHHVGTYLAASVADEAVDGIRVFGGLACNAASGGLNLAAVDAACAMGAKEIWMPTVSAVNHIRAFKGDMAQAVHLFTPNGAPVQELPGILERIAAADIILGTGHLSASEVLRLAPLARRHGVRKILVTHPEFVCIGMSTEDQRILAAQGVFFERCFYASSSAQKYSVAALAHDIKAVGSGSTVLASDLGQAELTPPAEGLLAFARALHTEGISEADLERMLRGNPADLLGLSD